jgi:hypothetical protein
MASIIDALLVTLSLDSSGFKKGSADAQKELESFGKKSKRGNKELTDAEKKAEKERIAQGKAAKVRNKDFVDGLARVRNTTLGLMAVFMAGKELISFATSSISMTASLSRLSENTGMSAYKLGGLGLAMKNVGGTAEEMMSVVDKAAMSVASFSTGAADQGKTGYWQAGGRDAGAFKSTEAFLMAQADLVKQNIDLYGEQIARRKALTIMEMSANQFNLSKGGGADLKQKMEAAAAITAITKKQEVASKRAQVQLNNLEEKTAAAGRAILTAVLEPISRWYAANEKDIAKLIKQFSAFLSNNTESGINVLVESLGVFVELLKVAAELLVGLYNLGVTTGIIIPKEKELERKDGETQKEFSARKALAVEEKFEKEKKIKASYEQGIYYQAIGAFNSVSQMLGMGGDQQAGGKTTVIHQTINANGRPVEEVNKLTVGANKNAVSIVKQAAGG